MRGKINISINISDKVESKRLIQYKHLCKMPEKRRLRKILKPARRYKKKERLKTKKQDEI